MPSGDLGDSLSYPFKRFGRVCNVFWTLIPIIGGFLFTGYVIRVIRGLYDGQKEMVEFGDFVDNLKHGFLATLAMMIPGFIFILLLGGSIAITALSYGIAVLFLLFLLISTILGLLMFISLPLLIFQYAENGSFVDGMNVFKALGFAFRNFGGFIVTGLKGFVLGLIWLIPYLIAMGLVVIIIGWPLVYLVGGIMGFSGYFLVADFYRKNKKVAKSKFML